MALIDTSYFFGELNIAQKSEVGAQITLFIDDKEFELLGLLLGHDMRKDFQDGIAAVTPAQKWVDLRDGKMYTARSGKVRRWDGLRYTIGTAKKSMVANYVYWHFAADKATTTTPGGEVKPQTGGAVNASEGWKMVRAWNQMVEMVWECVEFMLSNPADYPKFQDHYSYLVASAIVHKQNLHGI